VSEATSYPGSFFGKDPGSGWSRGSHFLGAKLTFFCGRSGRGACLSRCKNCNFGRWNLNLQQEIVKRTLKLIFISWCDFLLYNLVSSYNSSKLDQISILYIDLPKKSTRWRRDNKPTKYKKIYISESDRCGC
jgi:hypothetical protein